MLMLGAMALAGGRPTEAPPEVLEAYPPELSARHIARLAEPDLGGRMTATPGCYRAGDYIRGQFQELGLQGGGDDGGYFQHFTPRLLMAPDKACRLIVNGKDRGIRTKGE